MRATKIISIVLFVIGLILLIVSIIQYSTLKEEVIDPNCQPCTYSNYFKAFTGSAKCQLSCALNPEGGDFTVHDPIYYFYAKAGAVIVLLSLVLFFVRIKK